MPGVMRLPSRSRWLLVAAVVAIGLTLRSTIASIPPVLGAISTDLNLDGAAAGLLTSLPVLCFAIGSSLVALATHRMRTNGLILVSMLVLLVAVAVRPWGGTALILLGTMVMGLAITVGNVLLPTVVRRDFPRHIGPMTAVTSSTLNVGAAITAALTVPLAVVVGWRGANAAWALLALAAAVLWVVASRHTAPDNPAPRTVGATSAVWRSGDAWWLGAFFGLQSMLYYTTTQWLPSILQDIASLSRELAGTGLSLYQLFGVAGSLVFPVLAGRRSSWRGLGVLTAALAMICYLGVLLVPSAWVLWSVIGGLGQGGAVALGLALIAIRAIDSSATRAVSAMVQTVGYTIGAVGPVAIGALSEATTGWASTLVILMGGCVALGISAIRAGAPGPIGLAHAH